MKALVLQPMTNEMHHHAIYTVDAKRRCSHSENWRKLCPSTIGEHREGKTARSLEDSRRMRKSQLVNKWLALKRRTSGQQAVPSAAHSPGPSRDLNGNQSETPSTSHVHVSDVLRLPYDPRSWTPQDVRAWLRHMTETHDLKVDASFFQMNGRGLCLMPLKGFLFRVPDHGKLLYEDFRDRLRKCLLAPGNRLVVTGNEAKRRTATTLVSSQGVVIAGRSYVPDCKGRMSPLIYHTL